MRLEIFLPFWEEFDLLLCLGIDAGASLPVLLYELAKAGQNKFRIPQKHYRGSNWKERIKTLQRNRIATELERYINSKLKAEIENARETDYQFLYREMAHDTGYSEKTIRDILLSCWWWRQWIQLSR